MVLNAHKSSRPVKGPVCQQRPWLNLRKLSRREPKDTKSRSNSCLQLNDDDNKQDEEEDDAVMHNTSDAPSSNLFQYHSTNELGETIVKCNKNMSRLFSFPQAELQY